MDQADGQQFAVDENVSEASPVSALTIADNFDKVGAHHPHLRRFRSDFAEWLRFVFAGLRMRHLRSIDPENANYFAIPRERVAVIERYCGNIHAVRSRV